MILSHTKRIEGLAKCMNQIGNALKFMSIVALCTDALVATPSAIHHPHQQLIHSRSLTTLGNAQLDDNNSFEDVFADEASAAILSGQDLDIITLRGGDALKSFSPHSIVSSFKLGLSQRVAADPNFLLKSILEVVLAATTQYMAEVSRRGWNRMLPEIDFVLAGVLTAVIGKYYSCWSVAKTSVSKPKNETVTVASSIGKNIGSWGERVPTNAFQKTLLDGHTRPSMPSRFLAVIIPMPQLFRAGVIASTIGYGITSTMIQLRTMFIPSYVPQTNPVSVPLAALYTGAFMALISNIRYQLLQGVIEPYLIDNPFFKLQRLAETNNGLVGRIARWKIWKTIKGLLILAVRWANGLLGSWLAIGGMRALNLQQLKS